MTVNYEGYSEKDRTDPVSPDMSFLQTVTRYANSINYACHKINKFPYFLTSQVRGRAPNLEVQACHTLVNSCGRSIAVLDILYYFEYKVLLNLRCIQFLKTALWSSGQSSWLQIQRSGFDSRRYQIF
jgi:hypothetical protein